MNHFGETANKNELRFDEELSEHMEDYAALQRSKTGKFLTEEEFEARTGIKLR